MSRLLFQHWRVLNALFGQKAPSGVLTVHGCETPINIRDVVAIGGELTPDRLLRAYRQGFFPWYDEGEPILWWCPDPRAIFELDRFHIPRRLRRLIRSGKFRTTINRAFAGVIRGCADRAEGSWITPEMIACYELLHHQGHAHSVEVWDGDVLAGGVYGVAIGAFFAGESMFTRVRDASKVALVFLVHQLRSQGFQLFDVQFRTAHTTRFGAIDIRRADYLQRLRTAVALLKRFVP